MIVQNPAVTISRGRLIAVLIVGLTVAFQSAACGDQTKGGEPDRVTVKPSKPSDVNPISGVVTVTPSTGLKSTGDNPVAVTVSVGGFQPNMEVFAGQCAHIKGLFICESKLRPPTEFSTDKDGNGSTQLNVRRVFDGFVVAGEHWGRVDCTVDPCYVGVGNHTQGAASDRISFESAYRSKCLQDDEL